MSTEDSVDTGALFDEMTLKLLKLQLMCILSTINAYDTVIKRNVARICERTATTTTGDMSDSKPSEHESNNEGDLN